jgi:hypothetical protein
MIDDVFSNLDSIRLTPDLSAGAGVREILVTVPVKKPNRSEFVRVNRDPEMTLDTWLYHDKAEGSEFYLVAPTVSPALYGEARPFRLHVAIARPNVTFIWPLALPGEDGKTNPWHESALEAAELAKSSWLRLAADQCLGAYRIYRAEGALADPEWPDKTFPELLRIAFGQRLIDSENHPVIQRLRGLV